MGQLLQRDAVRSPAEYGTRIKRAIGRMKRLIGDVFEMSRMTSGLGLELALVPGDLAAFIRTSTWPKELPVSVLVALTTPDQPAKNVLQIIDSYPPVEVAFAVNNEPIKPGRIYASPPGKHLLVGRFGVLRIDEPSFFDSVQPSVNRLFSAAAVVFSARVIGVILSGNQYDGVQGMKDIEAAGGMTIVQEPDDGDAPQLPRHVLKNDSPRYVVKASEIESLLWHLLAAG